MAKKAKRRVLKKLNNKAAAKPKRAAKRKAAKRDKISRNVAKDLAQSKTIADETLGITPLSRVDASRPTEVTNLLNQHSALSDPFSQAYAGRRSEQTKDYIGQLSDLRQGYDSREFEAMREQRKREMERDFQSGRASLARAGARDSTARGAQLLELAKSYGQTGAQAENDLFVRGADEKRRAIDAYGNAVGTAEANEFARGQAALSNYSNLLNETRANELERQKINLGQEAADKAVTAGSQLGVMQLIDARRKARKQNKLIRQGYRSNERIAGAGGSAGNYYADALNKLAEEYAP